MSTRRRRRWTRSRWRRVPRARALGSSAEPSYSRALTTRSLSPVTVRLFPMGRGDRGSGREPVVELVAAERVFDDHGAVFLLRLLPPGQFVFQIATASGAQRLAVRQVLLKGAGGLAPVVQQPGPRPEDAGCLALAHPVCEHVGRVAAEAAGDTFGGLLVAGERGQFPARERVSLELAEVEPGLLESGGHYGHRENLLYCRAVSRAPACRRGSQRDRSQSADGGGKNRGPGTASRAARCPARSRPPRSPAAAGKRPWPVIRARKRPMTSSWSSAGSVTMP